MGFRFRRTIKVFPGVRLNISRSGVSTTVGVRGATVTMGMRGTAVNLGIPGSGLSYRQRIDGPTKSASQQSPVRSLPSQPLSQDPLPVPKEESPLLVGEIRSADSNALTSDSLIDLKNLLAEAYSELVRLRAELPAADIAFFRAQGIMIDWQNGWFLKNVLRNKYSRIVAEYQETKSEREELLEEIKKCRIALDIEMDSGVNESYGSLVTAFNILSSSEKCWDNTSSVSVNQVIERTTASQSITRSSVKLDMSPTDVINPSAPAIHFQNANGADMFFFPGLLLMYGSREEFALIRLEDVQCEYSLRKVQETEGVPSDAKVVSETWTKVNKDGSPDRRFKGNTRIPIVQYGRLTFMNEKGLNEQYLFSNASNAETFAKAFAVHRCSLGHSKNERQPNQAL